MNKKLYYCFFILLLIEAFVGFIGSSVKRFINNLVFY